MARPATAAVRLLTGEREPCRLATTGPIDVDTGGLLVIDGVQTEVGDRILVKDQTDGSENGIRTASEGQWYRAADARTARTMQKGTTVTIQEGAVNAGKTFKFDTLDPVIGDDALTFLDVTSQPLDSELTSWAAITRAAGFDTFVVTPTSNNFKALLTDDAIPTHAATRSAMKALDTTKDTVCFLTEAGRQGIFIWTTGDFSTHHATDTSEGVYVKATAIASTSGSWVRAIKDVLNVFWFGALGDNSNNDQAAFAAAYSVCKLIGTNTTEGPCGSIWAPAGYRYRFTSSLSLDVPVRLKVEGEIFYTPTTGAAIIVGSSLHTSRGNTQYDIDVSVLRAVNGNSVAPTGINTSGSIGVELRDVQFSRIKVEFAIAFTYAGIYANASNNVFTGQHIQDNWIWFGETAYCGVGFLAESHGAADGAFQVNEVHIQNSFGNWNNIVLGKSGDGNTNNNMFFVAAADADTGGGNVIVWSSYNFLQFGYINGTITLQSGSFYNRIHHQVGAAQCTISDSGTGNLVSNNVEGTLTQQRWQTTGLTPLQIIQSTDAGASVANLVDYYRNSASPAANDEGVSVSFSFNNASAAKFTGAEIESSLVTTTAGSEHARLRFFNKIGGARTNVANLWQGWAVGSSATDQGQGTVNVSTGYYLGGTSVIDTTTGLTVPTGKVAVPQTNDGAALGTTTLQWSDLFLASGGVVNWANGDVTITHAADTLTFAGAASGYTFSESIHGSSHIRVQSPSAGIGYRVGAGGSVTQATSKSTGVTLNTSCGQITMNAAALAAGTIVSFVLTNSSIAGTDMLVLQHLSGGTPGSYTLNARCAAGSATIDVRNNTAGSLSEALVLQFAIIKAVIT
jgi:hypothetical protein